LCNFLHSPVTSFLLATNIFLTRNILMTWMYWVFVRFYIFIIGSFKPFSWSVNKILSGYIKETVVG
jgi:hypothetical protein